MNSLELLGWCVLFLGGCCIYAALRWADRRVGGYGRLWKRKRRDP